jgi:two-component system, NtrC family, response regulator GlrR
VVSGHRGGSAALTLGDETSFFPDRVASATQEMERARFGRMIGQSTVMHRVFETLSRAAVRNTTVLLEGETGTGKEISAEAIHRTSRRRDKPFLVVDCGAIPPQLLESELFGHERGSFTGAVSSRQGVFEAAAGGTVFLDEIGELALDLQPKLLRVLERREVRRIGTNVHVPVDVRLIAATNRNMRGEVEARKFRADLFYRLAVVEVRLPPLRERTGDLPLLVEHIAETLRPLDEESEQALASPEFVASLASYDWPGNIRELRNFLERCVALGEYRAPQSYRRPSALSPEANVLTGRTLREAREEWTNTFEKRYLEELLLAHGNRVSAAARAAGVDRIYFYRLLWKHGLRTREASARDSDAPSAVEPKAP